MGYVFRTANNTVLYEENGDFFEAKSLSVDKIHNTLFFNDVEFAKQRFQVISNNENMTSISDIRKLGSLAIWNTLVLLFQV